MRHPLRETGRRLRAAAAACALVAAGAATGADKPVHVVQDPHYGDALFRFYQEDYFASITTLMTSQHFERVSHHADEAELLRGSMLLSYGQHREAGDIFAGLIEQGAPAPVRDRAWFYLAKIRYQRGFRAQAEEAIDRVGKHLPAPLEEERGLLKANLLMARSDHAGAARVLGAMTGSPRAGFYARYNLGVALIRSGDAARGSALLDELGRAPAADEEQRSLRDKANVALGFAALQEGRAEDARHSLERVRLKSLHANQALLGFGWAAAALKQPARALVPWMELAGRDASDSAVLEARIAVPYAYAELKAFGQSLDRYQDAIAAFERESAMLDESIAAVRGGKLVDALTARNPSDRMGWFWTLRDVPDMPHAGHLADVLAGHEFQEAFKNYRDLRLLATNLEHWADSLGVFDDMLANRRQAYAERLPRVIDGARASDSVLAALQQRRDALASELARVEAESDAAPFADARQRELQARVASVRENLQHARTDPQSGWAHERARLAAGALTWQLAQQYPVRLWEARKALRTIDAQLVEARARDAAVARAQRDEPARFERLAARIAELGPRVQALIPRVAALRIEQQGEVENLAVAALTRQKERLAVYLTQARFAVAQLHDRASQTGDHDAGQ